MTVAALAVYFPGGYSLSSHLDISDEVFIFSRDAAFYIQLYSIDHNVDTTLSFYSVNHTDPFLSSAQLTSVSSSLFSMVPVLLVDLAQIT